MSTGKRVPQLRRRAHGLGPAALLCALALVSATATAQAPGEDREFYLDEVLKGGTGSIRSLLLDARGTLWVGSQAGLFTLRDDTLVRAPGEDRAGMVNALLEVQGHVWVGGENGLFRIGSDGMSRVPGDETRLVYALAESGGSLWLGARNGLFRVGGGSVARSPDAGGAAVTTLLGDGTALWIGTNRLLRRTSGPPEGVGGVETGWIRALARSGPDLWVGADEGLFRVVDAALTRVDGARTGRVYALEVTPDGDPWIGAFNGLFAVEDGRIVRRGPEDLMGILSLHAEGDTLWIGALRGLFRWSAGEAVALSGPSSGWVGELLGDGESLWVGAEKGLFRLREGRMLRVGTLAERSPQPAELTRPEGAAGGRPPSAPAD